MNLPPQGRAGVSLGNQRALVVRIGGPRLQVAVVAARNQVLRRLGIREREPLNVKVELERRGRLAGEAAHGDQMGLACAREVDLMVACQFLRWAVGWHQPDKMQAS